MNSHDVEMHELLDRVGKLERQNRSWKIGSMLVILAIGISLTAAARAQQTPAQQNPLRATTVVAQDFQLRDTAGVLRGELSISSGEPKFELYNAAGKVVWSTTPRFTAQSRLN